MVGQPERSALIARENAMRRRPRSAEARRCRGRSAPRVSSRSARDRIPAATRARSSLGVVVRIARLSACLTGGIAAVSRSARYARRHGVMVAAIGLIAIRFQRSARASPSPRRVLPVRVARTMACRMSRSSSARRRPMRSRIRHRLRSVHRTFYLGGRPPAPARRAARFLRRMGVTLPGRRPKHALFGSQQMMMPSPMRALVGAVLAAGAVMGCLQAA